MTTKSWAIIMATMATMLPVTAVFGAPASGRVAYVIDGDTFRLSTGERIRIAGIDAPETQPNQARCREEILRGQVATRGARVLLGGRTVTLRRVGRSYRRTVAKISLDGQDVATLLVERGLAAWWPRGTPRPYWCENSRR